MVLGGVIWGEGNRGLGQRQRERADWGSALFGGDWVGAKTIPSLALGALWERVSPCA